jgi:hypothetical protein
MATGAHGGGCRYRRLPRRPEAYGAIGDPIVESMLSPAVEVLGDAGASWPQLGGNERFVSLPREDLATRFPGPLRAILRAAGSRAESRGAATRA